MASLACVMWCYSFRQFHTSIIPGTVALSTLHQSPLVLAFKSAFGCSLCHPSQTSYSSPGLHLSGKKLQSDLQKWSSSWLSTESMVLFSQSASSIVPWYRLAKNALQVFPIIQSLIWVSMHLLLGTPEAVLHLEQSVPQFLRVQPSTSQDCRWVNVLKYSAGPGL